MQKRITIIGQFAKNWFKFEKVAVVVGNTFHVVDLFYITKDTSEDVYQILLQNLRSKITNIKLKCKRVDLCLVPFHTVLECNLVHYQDNHPYLYLYHMHIHYQQIQHDTEIKIRKIKETAKAMNNNYWTVKNTISHLLCKWKMTLSDSCRNTIKHQTKSGQQI